MKSSELLLLASIAVVGAGFAAWFGYRTFFKSIIVDPPRGEATVEEGAAQSDATWTEEHVAKQLSAAGLSLDPALGDIGVRGHMERLRKGAVNKATLLRYASDLGTLSTLIGTHNVQIPPTFWDVETPALQDSGWNVYRIARELVQDHSRPYVDVLAKSYARFLRFKEPKANAGDTALDAALDILLIAGDYVNAMPPDRLLQHAPEIDTKLRATLMVWQNLIAGTTRKNPITHKPVFSHGFIKRYNVSTIYQYDLAKPMSISAVWGVSGFANRFVGTAENANQIEHLSISTVLQAILGEPLLVLNAVEEEKLLVEGTNSAEAHADMALNRAVHDVLLPRVDHDFREAVEALRSELKRQ